MIIGIYLAAGKSSRMGSDKLALPFGSGSLGSAALHTALQSNLDKVILVTKDVGQLQWVHSTVWVNEKLVHIKCEKAEEGQAESIKCGLKVAQLYKATSVIILLADQPLIEKEQIDYLIFLAKRNSPSYIACSFNEIARPPVLFHSKLFSKIAQLQGDQGARKIIREDPSGLKIEYQNERQFLDVDTSSDYEKIKKIIQLR
ncbi:hypothetical protein DS745_12060 [Anaerobacillus alkaliphilus]|uniref:MobA-like NTP transferase domain-containing protein n=1 Tax=Anaerobacillus alkaliphilus TaxID=1548597 RepID=A0A4Q0VS15_9BACI|nr:NTP transferase domain-containing protein [Anaerobacillus alkaliphilus]RXJ00261.1 hypothetical protein DS745_12060 [Anaerobacillus alkaliphilus]